MILVACLLLLPDPRVWAEVDAGPNGAQDKTITMLMPPSNFYPEYIADPVRPQSAVKLIYFPDSEIPDVGVGRIGLHLGGRFGLVRWHPEDEPDRGVQLDFEAGFLSQVYLDGGYSYILEEFQEAWRLQAGVQYLGVRRFWSERMTWYAALDLQSFQENQWQLRSTAQLGLILPTGRGTSRYRIAVEAGTGRSVMGEFFFRDETYIDIGWYFDF
jgi:hypothetical protein